VDTWGWIAVHDRSEKLHTPAVRCLEERMRARGRVITSDYVLDELITNLFGRRPFEEAWRFVEGLLAGAESRFVTIERVTESRFRTALEMRDRFRDKPRISFTDLTSMAIMQELRISDVLTADVHFSQVGLGFRRYPEM
jgi:predicted nucleic acid-binding protein